MNIQRKVKEPTAMEKRNTTIINFVLVAFIPLFLMFLMGFSFGKSDEVNEKKLLENVISLEAELKDYESKDSTMRQEFRALMSDFLEADAFRSSFQDEMGDLKSEIKGDLDESELRDWEKNKKRIVKSFDVNIEDVKARKYETVEFKKIHGMGLRWVEELFSVKDDELYALKLKKEYEIGGDVVQTLEARVRELETKLQMEQIKSSNLQGVQDIQEIINLQGGAAKKSQENDNSEYQIKYANTLAKNNEVKGKLIGKMSEANSLISQLKVTLKIGSFNTNKSELKNKMTEIQNELNNLKTSE